MAYLRVLKGSTLGRIDLAADRVIIGRSPNCGVVLPADSVSRHHMQILHDGASYMVEDLQSRNGTYVNGTRIARPTRLVDSACIKIGEYLLTFHSGADQPEEQPDLELVVTEDDNRSSHILSVLNSTTLMLEPGVQLDAKLRGVLEINQSLCSALSPAAILPKILDTLFTILPQTDCGYLLLKEKSNNRLIPKAVKHRRETADKSLRISRTVIEHVLQKRQAILLSDTSGDAQFRTRSVSEFNIRSIMCVPLLNQDHEPLGIVQIHTEDRKHLFTQDDLDLLVIVARAASVALENAQLHQDMLEQEQLNRDLQLAREVQRGFLPASLPDVPGYGFFAYYEATNSVGGDYYGFVDLPEDQLAIGVADVAGRGIRAAMLMAHLASDLRFAATIARDPAAAIGLTKREFVDAGLDDRIITILLMVLDKKKHTLTIASAGHLPPVLRNREGNLQTIGEELTGLPLNVHLEPDYRYKTAKITFEPGSVLLVYTDGVIEAVNSEGTMFGYERLEHAFKEAPADPAYAGEAVLRELRQFTSDADQSDDITLLCFGRKDAADGSTQ